LHRDWPFPIVVLVGGAVAAAVSIPLALPMLRLRGVFLAIATIGFGEVVRIFFVNWAYAGGALGLVGVPPKTEGWHIYLALAIVLFICLRLRGSRAGYALEAIRQDETTARTLGIDPAPYKLAAFVSGAFIAGAAGALQAHLFLIVDPNDYGFQRAVEILSYAVVGGTGLFVGPVLGAGLITLLPEILRNLSGLGISPGAVRQFVSGAVLLLVILYAPGGLITIVSRAVSGLSGLQRIRAAVSGP
jgi:branched-chain amino acid transport system permease protein